VGHTRGAYAGPVTSRPDVRRPGPTVRVRVTEHVAAGTRRHEDRVAGEEPLEVRLRWPGVQSRRVLVTMRTPGHDFELAAGLLFAEGLVGLDDIQGVAYCDDVRIDSRHAFNVVTLTVEQEPEGGIGERGESVTAASSACGVCGADSIESVLTTTRHRTALPAFLDDVRVPPAVVYALPDRLREHQRLFDTTGGLHAAGLATAEGRLLLVREDIGRHNAVDKVVGRRLLDGSPPSAPVLTVSGRLGYEIVQKAAVAGIPVVVAVGAPSSLAVELAHAAGVTLVGFARGERAVVYSHPGRIGV
jgi:FdhD protein